MKFFMLGDFHLGKEYEVSKAKTQLIDLCKRIRSESYPKEIILFVIMGDIINASDIAAFADAKICLDCIREELTEYDVRFEFIPGNHDLPCGDITPFDQFIAEYNHSCPFENSGAYSVIYDNVNFIFSDSNKLRNHKLPGKLDLDSIHQQIKPMQNLLFCHHGFRHSYGGDHDTVEYPEEVLVELKEMGVAFVFHAHTHRADVTVEKEGFVEIGCGTFLKNLNDMDGIQNQFLVGYIREDRVSIVDRIVVCKDGCTGYSRETIYPEQKVFRDPREINQIKYKRVDSYIQRKVVPHKTAILDEFERFFSKKEEMPLGEALKREKKVLFLSDAGGGKSVEMENLAYELCQEFYYPFLYKLRNYTGEEITDIIPKEYINLSPKVTVLLLDGYDELPMEYKICFESKMRRYLDDNPDVNIVLSSRSNFCKVEQGTESKTFPGFKVYDLCKLGRKSIEEYVKTQGIDPQDFFDAVERVKIYKLLENPFYLTQICKLFKNKGDLPAKINLMEELVEESFEFDEEKYTQDLGQDYEDLMQLLQKVAFSMQLMQKSKLIDRQEYQKLFEGEERKLLQHSGLFLKEGDTWRFVHNNFREYLAARYLSELSEEEVISYISSEGNINPSWVNTLGFLIGMSLTWDLNKWIETNAPTALVKYEPDTLDEDTRFKVFKDIFTYYEKRHLWFDDELCDEQQLAHFAECPELITFLLDRISRPINVVSQYTAISILRYVKRLYGKKGEILSCLLSCCENYPQTRFDVCRLAIFAIHQLNMGDRKVTNRLMNLFENTDNDYVRLGMYEYLLAVKEHNEFVGFFIEGVKYIIHKPFDSDHRIGNESFELVHGLKEMCTADSISTVVNYLSKHDSNFYDVNEVYECLSERAILLYEGGEQQLYDVFLQACLTNLSNYDSKKVKGCIRFFEGTNTLEKATIAIMSSLEEDIHFMNDMLFLRPQLTKVICDAYLREKFCNHNVFRKFVMRYVSDEKLYELCSDALFLKTNFSLPSFEPKIDYEKNRKDELQRYFDMLFSKESAQSMLIDLLENIGIADIRIEDVLDKSIGGIWETALRHLQCSVYHWGEPKWFVKDFFSEVSFERFSIVECKKILGDKNSIRISGEQRAWLIEQVTQNLNVDLLKKEVRQKEDGTIVTTYVMSLVFLAMYFDIELSEDILLELTMIPKVYYKEVGTKKKYDFLLKYTSETKIKERIENNLKDTVISPLLLEDHLQFCSKNKYDVAVDIALPLCQATDVDEWMQWNALEYLYNLYGANYVNSHILPYATGKFLLRIAQECKDISKKEMCLVLEAEYAKEPSYEMLSQLMVLGSIVGLEKYVEIVEKERKVPDRNQYHSATSSIKSIDNPECLYLLEKLLDIVLSQDFIDDTFWGLRNPLSEAFVNCGRTEPEKVISIVKKRLDNSNMEENNIRYCNYILEGIRANQRKFSDLPKTIQEVKTLLK